MHVIPLLTLMRGALATTCLAAAMTGAAWASPDHPRLTIPPAHETPGYLVHGVSLPVEKGEFPILVKIQNVNEPFVGKAYLQTPGRAFVHLVDYGGARVDGYVISPKDRKTGLPVKCQRMRKTDQLRECVLGELREGDKVIAVFPKGVDIVPRKPFGK